MSCAAVLAARYRPVRAMRGAVGALCGALLSRQKLETFKLGQGMPCSLCVLQRAAPTQVQTTEMPTVAGVPQQGRRATPEEAAYRKAGWPVRRQGSQVVLPLGQCATARIVPADLAEVITQILTALARPVPVLEHPGAPGCCVLIAGEPFSGPLPWPAQAQVVTGMLVLPPSQTPHGPVRWHRQAPIRPLANCREIDVFAAARTAGKAA
ncbi:MAG TPA: hypothetical protein VIY28_09855 [Pseudonocardiaceae bacterium]